MENWQSEYLQFSLFIIAAVWFVQRGSTESKPPGKEGGESDEEQIGRYAEADSPSWAAAGGWRTSLYSNSLFALILAIASIAVFSIWLRQRGSPQSKPVGEPHRSTGAEG